MYAINHVTLGFSIYQHDGARAAFFDSDQVYVLFISE
jgi:hypothetical protein